MPYQVIKYIKDISRPNVRNKEKIEINDKWYFEEALMLAQDDRRRAWATN